MLGERKWRALIHAFGRKTPTRNDGCDNVGRATAVVERHQFSRCCVGVCSPTCTPSALFCLSPEKQGDLPLSFLFRVRVRSPGQRAEMSHQSNSGAKKWGEYDGLLSYPFETFCRIPHISICANGIPTLKYPQRVFDSTPSPVIIRGGGGGP